jgi:hypothetical protein
MKWTIMTITFVSSLAFAQDGDFASRKKEMLAQIDENLAVIQEHKKCVEGATSPGTLRPCNEKAREARRGLRAIKGEKRMERQQEKMKSHGQ